MGDEISIPLPGKSDFRGALRIYVAGRNRFWTADEKRAAAQQNDSRSDSVEPVTVTGEARVEVGVPIPETLQFHRAAGTWRDEVPGGRNRPSRSRID
jgi:hypothetical protein